MKPMRMTKLPLLVALALLAMAGTALAQEVITEVTVIYGSSSGIKPPEGFVKVNKDLNKGAGGDFMYLCYKKGNGAPITGLVVTTSTSHPNTYERCVRVSTDLNRRAGGDYIYLWVTRDPDCAAVTDIIVLEGKGAGAPAGYTKINKDLNDGAGGAYLYFAYRKEPIPD